MLRQIRAAAKTRGVFCNLTIEDIVIPAVCPVFGTPLARPGTTFAGDRNSAPSVDKMKPQLGYTKGNVAIISLKANRLKSNATAAELEAVARWMRAQGLS